MQIKKLSHHRNGIGGAPFHVAIVKDEGREMLVIRFGQDADEGAGQICCAAFDLALLDRGVIEFAQNSWRGDEYAPCMDSAIAERNKL